MPIEGWLRQQFNIIEQFACQNVSLPASMTNPSKQVGRVYRPLHQQGNMFISISHWCNILKLNRETGLYDSVSLSEMKGQGVYCMAIEVPYIYIGEHKMGESFSVTLRVVEMWFEPDVVASPLIQVVPPPHQPPPPAAAVQHSHPALVEKNGRKRQPQKTRPVVQSQAP